MILSINYNMSVGKKKWTGAPEEKKMDWDFFSRKRPAYDDFFCVIRNQHTKKPMCDFFWSKWTTFFRKSYYKWSFCGQNLVRKQKNGLGFRGENYICVIY